MTTHHADTQRALANPGERYVRLLPPVQKTTLLTRKLGVHAVYIRHKGHEERISRAVFSLPEHDRAIIQGKATKCWTAGLLGEIRRAIGRDVYGRSNFCVIRNAERCRCHIDIFAS